MQYLAGARTKGERERERVREGERERGRGRGRGGAAAHTRQNDTVTTRGNSSVYSLLSALHDVYSCRAGLYI